MPFKSSIVPLPKDTTHSCVFDFPDRPVRPTPPPGPPPLYPYDPADDWNPSNPSDNGVPGSDQPQPGFDGFREIEFNSNIPVVSGSDRVLEAWALSSIGPYKVGPSTFSGIIWSTRFSSGVIHVTSSLPVWEGYDHQSGLDWPSTAIGGLYYIALFALVGNSPAPINVIDWMAATSPPTERVGFTTGLVDFAGCANDTPPGTISGTTTITTTVLSFASYAHAASWFRIV